MNVSDKMKIIVNLPLEDKHRKLLESKAPDAEFFYSDDVQVTRELVQTAHAVIGNVRPEWLEGSDALQWVQLNSAGTNGYTDGVLRNGVVLTNATGAYGLAISEHMLGMALLLQKKFHLYLRNQDKLVWKDEGNITSMHEATVLVVGLGDIGMEFARRCKAMGSKVIGVRRVKRDKPDEVDEVHTLEALDDLLPAADIVALSLPSTKETLHLFDAGRFEKMKEGAILLNVGRGTAIDQDALCDALESGRLGGAGLDVTDPEPLPCDHRLWKAPNLFLTPHISGGYHLSETLERIVRLAAGNLECWLHGRPMASVVDFSTGYRRLD